MIKFLHVADIFVFLIYANKFKIVHMCIDTQCACLTHTYSSTTPPTTVTTTIPAELIMRKFMEFEISLIDIQKH